jgi:hypothetical protein
MSGITKHSEKKDILTPWKRQARLKREVYTRTGVADPSIRRGMYHRIYNPGKPELNSRDGVAPPRRMPGAFGQDLQDFYDENHI